MLVVTTGVATVEGAIQAGIGFYVVTQLLTYLPCRFGGSSLVIVLFAFGALQYARHPEGVLEFQKRRSTQWFERQLFDPGRRRGRRAAVRPRAPMAEPPLLSLRGVAKSFGGVQRRQRHQLRCRGR